MHASASQPVQVAVIVTGLGGSVIQSNGGSQLSHAYTASVSPPTMPRHPLVPQAGNEKPMPPWRMPAAPTHTGETSPPPIINSGVTSSTATIVDSRAPELATIDASATLQNTPSNNSGSLEDTPANTAAVAAVQPEYHKAENLVLDRRAKVPKKRKLKILILCGGPNNREVSLYNLFVAAGFECVNYDRLNGQQFDLVGDVAKDEILRDIAAGEYVAAFASPECSTFSKLQNLPGPPPLRTAEGPGEIWHCIEQRRTKREGKNPHPDGG